MTDLVNVLEKISMDGLLHFYGIYMDFPPYSYHTPPLRSMSDYFITPGTIEESLYADLRYADLVVYQISPTTAIPATYPMLDPDIDLKRQYREVADVDEHGLPILR